MLTYVQNGHYEPLVTKRKGKVPTIGSKVFIRGLRMKVIDVVEDITRGRTIVKLG